MHHTMNSDKMVQFDFVYPATPGKLFSAPPADKGQLTEQDLLQRYLLPPMVPDAANGGTLSGMEWLLNTTAVVGNFRLIPSPPVLLATCYSEPAPGCEGDVAVAHAAAAEALRAELDALSATIAEREAALAAAGQVPPYKLLDPAQLPCYTFI